MPLSKNYLCNETLLGIEIRNGSSIDLHTTAFVTCVSYILELFQDFFLEIPLSALSLYFLLTSLIFSRRLEILNASFLETSRSSLATLRKAFNTITDEVDQFNSMYNIIAISIFLNFIIETCFVGYWLKNMEQIGFKNIVTSYIFYLIVQMVVILYGPVKVSDQVCSFVFFS